MTLFAAAQTVGMARRAQIEKRRLHSIERLRTAYELYEAGLTFKEIGIRVGRGDNPSVPVTGERAMQMVHKWVRWHILTLPKGTYSRLRKCKSLKAA